MSCMGFNLTQIDGKFCDLVIMVVSYCRLFSFTLFSHIDNRFVLKCLFLTEDDHFTLLNNVTPFVL